MKLSVKNRQLIAILFLVGYIFVAFFSQQLHHHHDDKKHDDIHKTIITAVDSEDNSSDCLGCHILHIGKYISSDVPQFQFVTYLPHDRVEVENKIVLPISTIATLCLRGPPALV